MPTDEYYRAGYWQGQTGVASSPGDIDAYARQQFDVGKLNGAKDWWVTQTQGSEPRDPDSYAN